MNHAANFPAINVLTPVGNLYLESSPSGLRRCAFVSSSSALAPADLFSAQPDNPLLNDALIQLREYFQGCLLYTSDAADDLLCVDLGGRRIIKKKIHQQHITLTI